MGYRNFVSINIALIGTGEKAESFAKYYANAGHVVFMAWKQDAGFELSKELSNIENIHVCSIEEAAALADLVIIASSPIHVREVVYWLGDVRKKVIIDATSNIHTNVEEQVNTFNAIKAITGSPHVVKVFSTRGYEQMLKPLFNHENTQLFMVGDSKKAKEITKILTIDLGVKIFFDMGGSEAIPLFNEMTRAWRRLSLTHDKTIITINPVRI